MANNIKNSNGFKNANVDFEGWLGSVLNCVNRIPTQLFTLDDMYAFEAELKSEYPDNRNIKAKIRQQLQFLRDKGVIEFLGNGNYKKKQGGMTVYSIAVEETVSGAFSVLASSKEEALSIAEDRYKKGDFVLEPGEVQQRKMAVVEPESNELVWIEF